MQISQRKNLVYIRESTATLPVGSAKTDRLALLKHAFPNSLSYFQVGSLQPEPALVYSPPSPQKHICFFKSRKHSPRSCLQALGASPFAPKCKNVNFSLFPWCKLPIITEGRKLQLKIILMLPLPRVFTPRDG